MCLFTPFGSKKKYVLQGDDNMVSYVNLFIIISMLLNVLKILELFYK